MTPLRKLAISLLCAIATPTLHGTVSGQSATFPRANTTMAGLGAHTFFNARSARLMQIVAEAKGRATIVRGIAFRRGIASGTSTGRNVTLTIRLGKGDFAKPNRTFASNWIGTPTTVLAKKKLVMPNWSIIPGRLPATFDFAPKLDRSYAYDGTKDLVLDMALDARADALFTNPDTAVYRQSGVHTGPAMRFGRSCSVNGRAFIASASFGVRRFGLWGSLVLATHNAPANKPTLMLLGATSPNLSIPGLCARLLATPDVLLSLGNSDSRGTTSAIVATGRFVQTPGSRFFAQALTIDTSRVSPLVLSDGVMVYLPTATEPPVAMKSLSASSSSATSASSSADGGIIFRIR